MIQRLQTASIWSEDLNNLLPFYRDVLGLPVGMESPGFVILGNPSEPVLGLGTHSDVHGKATDPARHIVGFSSDDVQADYARLKSAGVEFIEAPTEMGPVTVATCKDPEGNFVQILQFTGAM